ncbi:uncharacterized protein AC631_03524 [Debaryomyces fabryi]|uniref:HMA domain-containing protein n=1 Tax=Debaryomyces fabryi TaxID=58627 RepID=A0A0V1PWT3_9ASCO|nr:uncharacterized protein AC631_03524 [Debaryomyces fabryi]KSA00705.1 hypothetical protein AC631_03524 [Debaryomyces fabryi]CUM52116.1 unnamed protein product [Debaryomyces fabryi]
MEHLHLNLNNVHCKDCEEKIYVTFNKHFKIIRLDEKWSEEIDIPVNNDNTAYTYINGGNVDLYHKLNVETIESPLQNSIKRITKHLSKIGFDVLSWEFYKKGELELNSENIHEIQAVNDNDGNTNDWFFDLLNLWTKYQDKRQIKNHLKYCTKCSEEKNLNSSKVSGLKKESLLSAESFETVVDTNNEFRAVFSISGMSCASCVQSVSEIIGNFLGDKMDKANENELNYSVNLLLHTAVVIIPNKQIINKLIEAINDSGFECRLLEVLPVERSVNLKVTAILSGITCAACATSILSAVNGLPFVLECGINVVTKTGQFVMEEPSNEDSNLDKLKETIEDCGFDFQLVSSTRINYTLGKKQSRTINVSVEGMFCGHCPEIITNYLSSYGEAVVIDDPITLKHPYIKFTYIPNQEKKLNIRRFLFELNHLEPSNSELGYKINADKDGVFDCALVEPVTMDEHIRKLSKQETKRILVRLIIATVFAILTFIFGVVAMSLLPESNDFRKWVEEPIWAGNTSRNTWVLLILSTPVYFFAADIFHRKAIKEIKSLWFNKNSFKKRIFRFGSMNLLMCLGTSIAYYASIALLILSTQQEAHSNMGFHTTYFDSVVFLTFFLLIGRLLESFSKSKTAEAISNLGRLKPSKATLLEVADIKSDPVQYTNDEVVDVKLLEVNDYIRIATGESPPVDCVIVEGQSEFDESALTGESTPVKHFPGHQVFSGTVNVGNNSTIAKIVSLEGDSLIDQIVNTVRDGQLRKAPIERTADLLTGYFVPIITLLALITWIIWLSLGHSGVLPDSYLDIDIGGWTVWSLEFAIAVFVIACPCGIGLAAPTALFVGSGLAAKYGILAKGGGVAFQDGANINTICFDKTGTLTYGELKVTDYAFLIEGCKDQSYEDVIRHFSLQFARDLELASKHPLAKSVKAFVDNHGFKKYNILPSPNKIPQVENVSGKGLKGPIILDSIDDGSIWQKYQPTEAILGNEAMIHDNNVEITADEQKLLNKWKLECKSVILLAIKCTLLFKDERFHLTFIMACRDQIRSEANVVIKYLKEKQIKCYMITGDNKLTAEAIGKELDISPENIISEVLPDEKQARIKDLQKTRNNIVAMVGDGINDSPALATANVGIALSSGADLAVTSSDFILLNKSHPLITLVTLIDLSRVVFRRVKFNFAWSLVYNMIGIPIAAGVIYPYKNSRLNPVWASAAMAASSISVVMSSLALKLYRPRVKVDKVIQCEENLEDDDDEPCETSLNP